MILAGRYELLRQIGRGGMGQVWQARDVVLGRTVAVKAVQLAGTEDPTTADRFRREVVATAALSHPNIVTVHDAGTDGDTAFMVMELVPGHSLASVLRNEGTLGLDEALRIGEHVAAALASAHAAGVVHRDIKPANVLLDGALVKVVDFGIATLSQIGQTALTAPGTTVGTAEYMSPEQAMAAAVTAATDLYSLGCLLTAMLTGRPPFTGEHPLAVLRKQVDDRPPAVSRYRPDVPTELEHLVADLLAKEPAARPSAVEAHQVLASLRVLRDSGAARSVAPAAAGLTSAPGAPEQPAEPSDAATADWPATRGPAREVGGGVPAEVERGTATQPLRLPQTRIMPGAPTRASMPTDPATAMATAALTTDRLTDETASPEPRRPRRRALAILGIAALGALVALLALGSIERGSAPVTAPSPTSTPSPSPTPGPTEPGPSEASVPAAVSAVRAAIAAAVADEDAREDLTKGLEEVVKAVEDGQPGKIAAKLRELRRELDDLVEDGAVGTRAAAAVRTAVDALETALAGSLPPGGGGSGEGAASDED